MFEQTIPKFSGLFGVPYIGHFVPVNELRTLGLISLASFVKWVGLNCEGWTDIKDYPFTLDPDTSIGDECGGREPIHCFDSF